MTTRGYIQIFGELPTTTHHSKKIGKTSGGRTIMFDTSALVAAKDWWDTMIMSGQRRPKEPLSGPISLRVNLYFPALKKDAGKAMLDQPMTSKPDVDNLSKTIIDSLVRTGWLKHDANVFDLHIVKMRAYSSEPGASIIISDDK